VKLNGHLEEILGMDPLPGCVWLQTGIRYVFNSYASDVKGDRRCKVVLDGKCRDSGFEMKLANSGIKVVVDQCLKVVLQQAKY
jgi:predicted CoA-binding protein